MSSLRLRTARELILWGARCFTRAGLTFGHGTETALDEAAWLVLHAVQMPLDTNDAALDTALTETQRQAAIRLLEARIATRQPAAYLTREAWFARHSFYVDERVLIPRSPLAELIMTQFTPWVAPERITRILDMGTGSGCIGIACAHVFPRAQVVLSDICLKALEIARVNVTRHDMGRRVSVVRSNLFDGLAGQTFDLIVSNPPYVEEVEMVELPPEYCHEPAHALAAGADGLSIVLPLLMRAGDHLNPGGILVVEVGQRAEALAERLPQAPFTWLEFARGGEGVLLLTAEQCQALQC